MVLKRLVALEPAERNFLRLGELCSQTGDKAGAAARLPQAGRDDGSLRLPTPRSGSERAYTEDSHRPKIALGYGKSLIARARSGRRFLFWNHWPRRQDAGLETREPT